MSPERKPKISRTWFIFALAMAMIMVLGVRNHLAARAVFLGTGIHASDSHDDDGNYTSLATLAVRDSILSIVEAEVRNPFKTKEKVAPVVNTTKKPTMRKRTIPQPKLVTLLYDSVGPCAQITVGKSRSGWLHGGDQFEGWKVEDITSDQVLLSHQGRVVVLK